MFQGIVRRTALVALLFGSLTLTACSTSADESGMQSNGSVDDNSLATGLTVENAVAALVASCTDLSDFVADPSSWEVVGSPDSDPLDLQLVGGDGGSMEITYTNDELGEQIAIPSSNYDSTNWFLAASGCQGIQGLDLSVLNVDGGSDSGTVEPNYVYMPDVVGLSEKDATTYLFNNGIARPKVKYQFTNPSQACMALGTGPVLQTWPSYNEPVDPDTPFTVVFLVDCQLNPNF